MGIFRPNGGIDPGDHPPSAVYELAESSAQRDRESRVGCLATGPSFMTMFIFVARTRLGLKSVTGCIRTVCDHGSGVVLQLRATSRADRVPIEDDMVPWRRSKTRVPHAGRR